MYAARRVKLWKEYNEQRDELQEALNEINAINGQIIQVMPTTGSYAVIIYKY